MKDTPAAALDSPVIKGRLAFLVACEGQAPVLPFQWKHDAVLSPGFPDAPTWWQDKVQTSCWAVSLWADSLLFAPGNSWAIVWSTRRTVGLFKNGHHWDPWIPLLPFHSWEHRPPFQCYLNTTGCVCCKRALEWSTKQACCIKALSPLRSDSSTAKSVFWFSV